MIAKDPVEIFNLYSVLPGYGESSIDLRCKDNSVELVVGYDSKSAELQNITFLFEGCVAFEFASFPGITMYTNERNTEINLGSLVEFKSSDYADGWEKHLNYFNKTLKHFSILFLSENKQLNILAKNVEIN
ncbi:MAG: hypothetical protein JWM14_3135 [Chitinophagaceae bacterium]|nr:hypothetical protein [Chitinophagaceae bacterium]